MSTIASRDLRNHTREVLERVASVDVVTDTVNGRPVADLRAHEHNRRLTMAKSDFASLHAGQRLDPTLAIDLAWISEGDTEELGPIP